MKLYVVGLGPGGFEQMTQRAKDALEESGVLAGYTVYVDLIKAYYPNKTLLVTPMKQEIERCRMAFEAAVDDKIVSMVCSGDPGVYGMAGLIYELSPQYPTVEIEVIPGVTAACSGAAILGAPLIHDFAVISLSDLLTPWEQIEQRLDCAVRAEFVLCIYNPSSKKRVDYLQKACDIILRHRSGDTVCGVARNIGRDGEEGQVMTLSELRNARVDMFSTVFVGSGATRNINGKMVTDRGYMKKGNQLFSRHALGRV